MRFFRSRIGFNINYNIFYTEDRGNVLVKALCYKPEGRGFDAQ
jgi:hypothetical protein